MFHRVFCAFVLLLVGMTPLSAAFAQQEKDSVADVVKLNGPDRQKILEDGARAEKEVMLYTSLIVEQMVRPIQEAFEKKYPFIKLNYLRSNSTQLLQRILAETKSGNVHADVVVASAATIMKKAGVIAAFHSPELAAFPKDHLDSDGMLAPTRYAFQGIGYNTRLVKPEDAPQSYEDLLDPKWRGKMIWATSPDTGGPLVISHLRKIMGEEKAMAYFKKLSEQKIATSGSSIRAILDQVIAGEYAIGISMALHHIAISKEKGASVDGTLPEPVIGRSEEAVLMKAAPHPHAAMLLIDFILSREGQELFREAQYFPARTDVEPLPSMRDLTPHVRGKAESIISDEELDELRPRSIEIFRQLFR